MTQQTVSIQSNRTTDKMIEAVGKDIAKGAGFISLYSILHVGAGDGSVLTSKHFDDQDTHVKLPRKSGIEKSAEHVSSWKNQIDFIGGDFFENSLSDVNVDVLFCHPPHSDYEAWAVKVIEESYAVVNYLVLPEQWHTSEAVKRALNNRGFTATVILGQSIGAADSDIRIDVIRVISSLRLDREVMMKSVPWDSRYEEEFIEQGKLIFTCHYVEENKATDDQFIALFPNLATIEEKHILPSNEKGNSADSIFENSNTLAGMVDSYAKDKEKIIANYKTLDGLDLALFKALDLDTLKERLQESLDALRLLYWNAFIKSYEPIISRLTSDYADLIRKEAFSKTTIEFTISNALVITTLIVKRASTYSDDQVKYFFHKFSMDSNAKPYNSNTNELSFEGRQYFKRDNPNSYYSLGFETIKGDLFNASTNYRSDLICGVSAKKTIEDIVIIAKLIGMQGVVENPIDSDILDRGLDFGQRIITTIETDGKITDLFGIKFYKNGNQHLNFCKEFILRLNIYIAKLLGWVESAKDAFDEMCPEGVNEEEFNALWDDTAINSINEANANISLGV